MNSELPFGFLDVLEFSRVNMIKCAELNCEINYLICLMTEFNCLLHSNTQEETRKHRYELIRQCLKNIRTKMMDYETAYHALMSKCNEL